MWIERKGELFQALIAVIFMYTCVSHAQAPLDFLKEYRKNPNSKKSIQMAVELCGSQGLALACVVARQRGDASTLVKLGDSIDQSCKRGEWQSCLRAAENASTHGQWWSYLQPAIEVCLSGETPEACSRLYSVVQRKGDFTGFADIVRQQCRNGRGVACRIGHKWLADPESTKALANHCRVKKQVASCDLVGSERDKLAAYKKACESNSPTGCLRLGRRYLQQGGKARAAKIQKFICANFDLKKCETAETLETFFAPRAIAKND